MQFDTSRRLHLQNIFSTNMSWNQYFTYSSIRALSFESETRHESELVVLLRSILQSNPTIMHERDYRGYTLLPYAVRFRSVEFVKLLVEADRGADCVRLIDVCGWLPFHWACHFCNVETAEYIFALPR